MKRNCLVVVVILSLSLGLGARGDERGELERQFRDLYKGNVGTLRSFRRGTRLRFDAEGRLLQGGKPGPWSLYAKVEVVDVKFEKDTLRFTGNRLYMVFDDQKGDFSYLRGGKVTIDIEIPREERTVPRVQEHMAKVFMPANELVSDEMVQCWRGYLERLNQRPEEAEGKEGVSRGIGGCGQTMKASGVANDLQAERILPGETEPPRCISCKEPAYTPEAKKARVQGMVVLWTIIDEQGRANEIRIMKPLGIGLDEEAVRAVQYWKFEPAKRDGKPVRVYMAIEVNFHLF
jgi:TonB family protein